MAEMPIYIKGGDAYLYIYIKGVALQGCMLQLLTTVGKDRFFNFYNF